MSLTCKCSTSLDALNERNDEETDNFDALLLLNISISLAEPPLF